MTTAFEPASSANTYLPWSIDQVGDPYAVYNSLSRTSSRKDQSAASPVAAQQDTAHISATSVLLATTETASRTARIESLRQNIANGTYSVSPYRVASSLLQSLL